MSQSPFPAGEADESEVPDGIVGIVIRAAQRAVALARGLPEDADVAFKSLTPGELVLAGNAATAALAEMTTPAAP